MEKRVLLATVLSLGFLFLWQYLTYRPQEQKMQQVESEYKNKEQKEEIQQKMGFYEPYIVETERLKLVFNKYGAGIREIYIKENSAQEYTLLCKDSQDSLFVSSEVKFDVKEIEGEKHSVSFIAKDISVQYIFPKDNPYKINVDISVSKPKRFEFMLQHYIHSDRFSEEPNVVHICKLVKADNKDMMLVEKVNKTELTKRDDLFWIAVGDKYYFVGIIFPKLPIDVKVEKKTKNVKQLVFAPSETVRKFNYELLIAPKKISLLTSFGNKFIHTVEWGTFAPLSKLFYNILTYFYKLFGNYGVAIIGLTLVTQIFTFPLTLNSIKATIKMKKLQPQIQLLQKVYKDDPKRLNMEIMNLYKEKKVNPFGGCLPLLLQIPIFWALFTMLRNTYDLRGASFILWIKDLSSPDKLVIPGTNFGIPVLVLLMGISMLIQQILSGAFKDPQQKTFAIMMPVIFTVLFINFPSGLVLYWFINNLFSIVLQVVVSRTTEV
ncbi:MAG: YidC/Oxa1 family insertase periplasmic-domain containing protein [Endomicrobia bacterium]|nr:YidC/Oxa1 family insertase periplasmic-domain containing protein [Endomicrobiia bacterium]MDW8055740.1 YidC/Oxa1 family insertase periplasmic-domain containing protein [Elusimicrobiota bacterium]